MLIHVAHDQMILYVGIQLARYNPHLFKRVPGIAGQRRMHPVQHP